MTKESGFNSQQGQEIFLFSIASRQALGPTQPPIQWVLGAVFFDVKQQGHEASHSTPPGAEVNIREWWSCISTHANVFVM
jgi:hypothetical protein